MLPTERLDYSAISERRPLALPDGARLVVWVRPGPSQPTGFDPVKRSMTPTERSIIAR